jgi:hypothetical protein
MDRAVLFGLTGPLLFASVQQAPPPARPGAAIDAHVRARPYLAALDEAARAARVPADPFVVTAREGLPSFLLRPGAYRSVVRDVTGKTLGAQAGLRVE